MGVTEEEPINRGEQRSASLGDGVMHAGRGVVGAEIGALLEHDRQCSAVGGELAQQPFQLIRVRHTTHSAKGFVAPIAASW